jgi:hypothetical protein
VNDETGGPPHSGMPQDRGSDEHHVTSDVAVLAFLAVLAVACVGGYFLLTKLIDMSRQEDCMLGGRHDCVAPLVVPDR